MTNKNNTLDNKIWQFFSYLFHPLFIPVYIAGFLLYYNNNLFEKNTLQQQNSFFLNIIVNLVLFQAFTVFLLKQLKFISSIFLPTQKERIIPIFAYTIYTFWVWAFILMKNPAHYPKIAINMGLAFFIASSATLVLNSFYKISLHLIGAGLLLGITIVCFFKLNSSYWFIILASIITIAIYFSRKNISNHTAFEMYSGFMLGLSTMLIMQFVF